MITIKTADDLFVSSSYYAEIPHHEAVLVAVAFPMVWKTAGRSLLTNAERKHNEAGTASGPPPAICLVLFRFKGQSMTGDSASDRILRKVKSLGMGLSESQKSRICDVPEARLMQVFMQIEGCESPKLVMKAIIDAVNEHENG